MEELIADCLRALEEAGEVGLEELLAAHPSLRAELEACLAELWNAGLVDQTRAPATDAGGRPHPAEPSGRA